jgi:hypothetical protein
MWSSTSSASVSHVDDTPSTSDVKVGKKKKTVKFPCMLCKGNHYSHLFPRMDEASSLLEKIQLPKGYLKLSSDPSLVDGLVDPVSSSISPTLHQKSDTKVVDSVLSLVDPTPPLMSAKVTDPVPSSVSPTLPLKSAKVIDPVSPSVEPIPPLGNVEVTDPVPSSVSPTLPLKSAEMVYPSPPLFDPIQSSIDPTLLIESKLDTAHVFLVNTDSTMPGGIPPPPMEPPPSTEVILFDWGALTGPRLPSHIPFQIIVQVRGRDVPQTLIDEGASVSILSSVAWYSLGCPQLAPVT